jgi:hypothetical protein
MVSELREAPWSAAALPPLWFQHLTFLSGLEGGSKLLHSKALRALRIRWFKT